MSDRMGAKAISLVSRDGITEDRTARVFHADGSNGATYTVTVGSRGTTCSCPAGQASRACYHGRAAHLFMERERRARGGEGKRLVADVFGAKAADELAKWAIDALVEPPARIDTATTRIPKGLVERGRALLEGAGLDWRALKDSQRSASRDRRERA